MHMFEILIKFLIKKKKKFEEESGLPGNNV